MSALKRSRKEDTTMFYAITEGGTHVPNDWGGVLHEIEYDLVYYSVDEIASLIAEYVDVNALANPLKESLKKLILWLDTNMWDYGNKICALLDCGFSVIDIFNKFKNFDNLFFWDYSYVDFDPEEYLEMSQEEFEELLKCGTVTDVGWAYIQTDCIMAI